MGQQNEQNFSSKLGAQLASLRKAKGITQGELGALLTEHLEGKYSQPVVARMESGTRNISAEELVVYCKLIGSDPSVALSEITGQSSENRLIRLANETERLSDQFTDLVPKFESVFDRCLQALLDHARSEGVHDPSVLPYLPTQSTKEAAIRNISSANRTLISLSSQARAFSRGEIIAFTQAWTDN